MLSFLVPHLLDDGARLDVGLGQPLEMTLKMLFHLTLGFGEKAKADSIAQSCSGGADRKRPCVPQRIEQTGATAQLGNPSAASRPDGRPPPARRARTASRSAGEFAASACASYIACAQTSPT